MKNNIVSFLLAGLMIMTSAFCDESLKTQITASALLNEGIESMPLSSLFEEASAYAAHIADDTFSLPACHHVDFTQLIGHTGDVSLQRGWLELPEGVYRIVYAAQLENSGGADVIQLWLTKKARHPKKSAKIIPDSSVLVAIDPAISSPVSFQASAVLLLKLKKKALIRLNYSTRGKSNLSDIPPSMSPITDIPSAPLPFYLIATKIGEV